MPRAPVVSLSTLGPSRRGGAALEARARANAATLALALALASACGPDAADYPFVRTERCGGGRCDAGPPPMPDAGPGDAGPPTVPDEPLEAWDTADAGPLSGLFAVEVVVRARVVIDVETRQLYRMRILQRGRETRVLSQPCRVGLPTVTGVAELTIPAALEELLRTKRIEATGDFLSGASPIGATFAPPAEPLLLGVELAEPFTDPLPTADMPAGAIDEDGDGNAGVTVGAETVLCTRPELAYVAIRTTAALSGTVSDLDTIEGEVVDPDLDFSILGYSDSCLAVAADLVITAQPGSTFRALRVGEAQDLDGNGNVSCTELVWHAPRLFGAHWL